MGLRLICFELSMCHLAMRAAYGYEEVFVFHFPSRAVGLSVDAPYLMRDWRYTTTQSAPYPST